jgi:hypothetical protein
MPDDPTLEQIIEAFGWSYTPAGVDRVLDQEKHRLATRDGRRCLYGRALALAEGVFT